METMPGRLRCYIASPLGFSEAGRYYYSRVLLPALEPIVEPVDPWALVTDAELVAAEEAGTEAELAREIGERNREALAGCDLLMAVLDGQEIDAGTAAEVGFASALRIQCFGLRTDRRETGEPGATVNLQVEAFILTSGGFIVSSLEELVETIGAAVRARERERVSA